MFNEQVKIDCLNYYEGTSSSVGLKKIFTISAPYEEKYQKDLCNFVYDEISIIMLELNSPSIISARTYLSYLRRYIDFCIDKGLSIDGINHTIEFLGEDLSKFVNRFKMEGGFFSEAEIQGIAKSLNNPMDSMMILGLFEGLTAKELCWLTGEDVSQNPIKTCDREILMSEDFIFYAKKSAIVDQYISESRDSELEKNDFCIKFLARAKVRNRGVICTKRMNSLKRSSDIPTNMNIVSLKKSGLRNSLLKKISEMEISSDALLTKADNIREEMKRYNYTVLSRVKEDIGKSLD